MSEQICKARRRLLKSGMAVALAGFGVRTSFGAVSPIEGSARELDFYNLHTGESLKAAYWENGQYLHDALGEINHILRDHRTGQISVIEPGLLDLLHQLRNRLDASQPIQIISGYRSPASNTRLAARSDGVAKGSLHMQGKAVDIHIEGVSLNDLRGAAIALQGGGVGYYPSSNFVHVDVGRVRNW